MPATIGACLIRPSRVGGRPNLACAPSTQQRQPMFSPAPWSTKLKQSSLLGRRTRDAARLAGFGGEEVVHRLEEAGAGGAVPQQQALSSSCSHPEDSAPISGSAPAPMKQLPVPAAPNGRTLLGHSAAAAAAEQADQAALAAANQGQPADEVQSGTQPTPADSLPQPLTVLQYHVEDTSVPDAEPETTYYILGTAHVSRQSCEDVAALIRAVKPQFVLLELCKERKPMLHPEFATPQLSLRQVLAAVRSGRVPPFDAVYSWLLARAGRGLDVPPGEEFRVALREAAAVRALVVLGDRPISITLARMWQALGGWEKARLLCSMLWLGVSMRGGEAARKEIERLKEADVLTESVKELGKAHPSLLRTLVTERDAYLTLMLRKLAGRASTVVAVVGAGHLQGIRYNWDKEIVIDDLIGLPQRQRQQEGMPPWRRLAVLLLAVMAAVLLWLLLARPCG